MPRVEDQNFDPFIRLDWPLSFTPPYLHSSHLQLYSMAETLFAKSVPWYTETVPPVSPAMRELLVQYAGIEDAAVEEHLAEVRDAAWSVVGVPGRCPASRRCC